MQVGCQIESKWNLNSPEMQPLTITWKKAKTTYLSKVKKETLKKKSPNLTISFSESKITDAFSEEKPKIQLSLFDELTSQAHQHLSKIEDTLWKKVCVDVSNMMGMFSVLMISSSKLGEISCHDKIANIYCPTEEAAQFLQQYAFIILGILRQYFPALKEIRSRNEFDRISSSGSHF